MRATQMIEDNSGRVGSATTLPSAPVPLLMGAEPAELLSEALTWTRRVSRKWSQLRRNLKTQYQMLPFPFHLHVRQDAPITKVACSSKPFFERSRAAVLHPWMSCSPRIVAICFGYNTSESLVMSILTNYIYRYKMYIYIYLHRWSFFASLPHIITSVFLPLPMLLKQLRHHHLKRCWQLIPSILLTRICFHSLGSFSDRKY